MPDRLLAIITDRKGPVAALWLPGDADLGALRTEFEAIMNPGRNPWCHEQDPPRQRAWVERVREREQFLTLKYGGSAAEDGETFYGPLTFANWLVREKGARSVPYREHCMTEFP